MSVKLALDVAGYTGPAEKASKSTDDIGESAKRSAAKHGAGMQSIARGAGVAAAAGALGLHQIVGAAMDFDKAMSGVAAVSNASAGELNSLREAALKAGADTSFSASEAAKAEAELAKAGVSTADILGGALTGSLGLAAAGQLELADAATISAQAMNIFKLEGSDVGHIADVLAAGANKSAADVSDLGMAMKQGGLVAAQTGLSFEDTIGTLSAFADRALLGSDAGTSLKTMLQRLAAPSGEAADAMKRLGISAFDAGGNFVGMDVFAGQLQSGLGKLTQEQRQAAMATIFGSDAVRAAGVLYEIGAGGVKEYTEAVNDEGAAGRMAAAQLDNLSGDLEALRGSIETALIKTGSQGTGALRALTKAASGAVNEFASLPPQVQQGALALVAVGTAGAGALAVLGTLIPKVRTARATLADMGRAGEIANVSIGKIGKGLAVGGGVFAGLALLSTAVDQIAASFVDAAPGVEELTSHLMAFSRADLGRTLKGAGEGLGSIGKEFERASGSVSGFADNVDKAISKIGPDSVEIKQAREDIGALDAALAGLVSSGHTSEATRAFEQLTFAAGEQGVGIDVVEKGLPLYRDALAGAANAATLASKETGKVGKAAVAAGGDLLTQSLAVDEAGRKTQTFTGTARDAAGELVKYASAAELLKAKLDLLNDANLTAAEADIRYRDSLATLTQSIKDNGRTVDLNTQKGRDNVGVVIAAVRAASTHAQAVANQTGSVAKGNAVFAGHIEQLRRTLTAAGLTKTQVDRLVAAYGRVPPTVSTSVKASTGQAEAALGRIRSHLTQIRLQSGQVVKVTVQENRIITGGGAGRGGTEKNAAGGWLTGGTAGVDSIPLGNGSLGMPGEYIVNADAAAAYGPLLEAINAGRAAAPARAAWRPGRAAAGGGNTYNITVAVAPGGHPAETGGVIVDLIRSYEQRSGDGWRQ